MTGKAACMSVRKLPSKRRQARRSDWGDETITETSGAHPKLTVSLATEAFSQPLAQYRKAHRESVRDPRG